MKNYSWIFMKTKGIIFDFGFTLFEFKDASVENYLNSYKEGLNKTVERLKECQIIKDNEVEKLFIKTFIKERNDNFKNSMKTKCEFPTHTIFQSVMEKLGFEKLKPDYYQHLSDIYHSHEEQQWIPLKNTKKTLEILIENKNLKIAVLSNHPNHNSIENVLKKYKLLKYFDVIVTSAKFGKRKPDPKIFLYTIEKMGLTDPSSCVVVGDEYADIMGGHRVGLTPILYERKIKFPFEQEIEIKDYIKVSDISEILHYI